MHMHDGGDDDKKKKEEKQSDFHPDPGEYDQEEAGQRFGQGESPIVKDVS